MHFQYRCSNFWIELHFKKEKFDHALLHWRCCLVWLHTDVAVIAHFKPCILLSGVWQFFFQFWFLFPWLLSSLLLCIDVKLAKKNIVKWISWVEKYRAQNSMLIISNVWHPYFPKSLLNRSFHIVKALTWRPLPLPPWSNQKKRQRNCYLSNSHATEITLATQKCNSNILNYGNWLSECQIEHKLISTA